MDKIPVRHIDGAQIKPDYSGNFSIRDVQDLHEGKDIVQELHRHDFFHILALEKGKGIHEIDFVSYEVCDHSVFIMRPGQVHQLTLKAGSTGFLMEFNNDFYFPNDNISTQLLRKASNINLYHLDYERFQKLFSILTYIFNEYSDRQEAYYEVIKANLGILFIELIRHSQNPIRLLKNKAPYAQERLEEFMNLLETHISVQKQVSHYADMLNLSSYQLNAITKATLSKKSSELINEYIILESKRYLLTSRTG